MIYLVLSNPQRLICQRNWNLIKGSFVTYWPSTKLSIKRCTCVNNSGSRWAWDNYITRCHRRLGLESVPVGDRMPAEWEQALDRGLGLSVTHGWPTQPSQWPTVEQPSKNKKEVLLWSEELGSICSSLSPSPTHLSHTTSNNPFENKVWEI